MFIRADSDKCWSYIYDRNKVSSIPTSVIDRKEYSFKNEKDTVEGFASYFRSLT